jgi:ATP-dependent Clp protease ATP-binding subunit ClpA
VFERFNLAGRQAIWSAREEAESFDHGYLGTEHLLLGLLRGHSGAGTRALDLLGIELEDVRSDVRRIVGTGSSAIEHADAEALRSIGIDLDEVRAHVERSFGPGSLDRPRDRGGARRRCAPGPGRIPLTCRSKKVLELAVREARHLGHGSIGTEHLVLALVGERSGLAAEILAARGATERRVRGIVLGELRRDLPGRSA